MHANRAVLALFAYRAAPPNQRSLTNKELPATVSPMDCVYCTLPEISERAIVRERHVWAFPTNIPIVPGHLIVLPTRCVARIEELSEEELHALMDLRLRLKRALHLVFQASGFNYAWNEGESAGQSIPHLHLHIVPRNVGDAGVLQYEPREFLYRPGSRAVTPAAELAEIAQAVRVNLRS